MSSSFRFQVLSFITNMLSNIIHIVKKYKTEIILIIIVFLISLFSFAMGYIVAKYQNIEPIQFIENSN